jgi:hypothetical protein
MHESSKSMSLGGLTMIATAMGAVAVGAFAIGAFAIGRLAVGRLVVGNVKFKSVEIETLSVSRLRAADVTVTNSVKLPVRDVDQNLPMATARQDMNLATDS